MEYRKDMPLRIFCLKDLFYICCLSNTNAMKNICFFVLIGLLASCSNNRDLKSISTEYSYLEGWVLPCDSMIGSSYIEGFYDGKILIRDYSNDRIFTVYDCINNQLKEIGGFGKKGGGPYEFPGNGKIECYIDELNSCLYLFWINSANALITYRIDITTMDNLFHAETWEQIEMPAVDENIWSMFLPLSDAFFVGLGGNYNTTNLLSALHIKDGKVDDLNIAFPKDGIDVEPVIKRFVYGAGGLLKKTSADKLLYYCANWGNYAEIITFEDKKVLHRQVITNEHPIYKLAPDGINRESEMNTLMGMESYVTDNYIYLLPNFLTKREYLYERNPDGYPNSYLKLLYVFNWEGEFEKAFEFSKPVRRFVVSPDDSFILASSDNPATGDVEILKFDL